MDKELKTLLKAMAKAIAYLLIIEKEHLEKIQRQAVTMDLSGAIGYVDKLLKDISG